MLLYAPQTVATPGGSVYTISPTPSGNVWYRPGPGSGFIPGGTLPLSQIQVGETLYRLRRPMQGVFVPNGSGSWEFWVEGFSPLFIGQGVHTEAAYRDWCDRVHETFQELYRKRPFERTADEQRQWAMLEDLLDVAGYQNETPILVRQIGQITQARPLPRQITWVDGSKENHVDLSQMPDEFASYKPGQWFEVIVERDPLTWRLRRVRYVQRAPSLQPMTKSLRKQYWDSLATTRTLPESSTDWTQR